MPELIYALIFIGVVMYLITGFVFFATCSWALGMPNSSIRTKAQKLKKFALETSMIFFWPGWMIYVLT